jgi:hypothetical protein
MKININDIEIPADESILPELSRQLLDLLNNSYKAVYSRNLSAVPPQRMATQQLGMVMWKRLYCAELTTP